MLWDEYSSYYITKCWYDMYLSPHTKETGCVHEHLVICVQLFWSGVYAELWLTPSRCSCWQSCAAAVLDTRIFSLCLGPVIHIYRAERANMLNCWPPFILGLSRKRRSSLERQCACTWGEEMSGVGEEEFHSDNERNLVFEIRGCRETEMCDGRERERGFGTEGNR